MNLSLRRCKAYRSPRSIEGMNFCGGMNNKISSIKLGGADDIKSASMKKKIYIF